MARTRRKANRTGRREGRDQYLTVGYPIARSVAWRSLGGAAVKVWIELHTRYHGGNNGKLNLSLDEAARALGLGKATVDRALMEFIEGILGLYPKGTVVREKGEPVRAHAQVVGGATGNKRLDALGAETGWSEKARLSNFVGTV